MVRTPFDQPVVEDDGTYADVEAVASGVTTTTAGPLAPAPRRPRKGLWGLAALAFAGGLIWSVYSLGDPAAGLPAGHPDPSSLPTAVAAATTPPPLDVARVARLEAAVAADPADAASVRALGDLYFRSELFADSAAWLEKFVALQPDDLDSRLVLGVAYFNQARLAEAEVQWLKAAEISPTSPHPHYNLGFLAMSKDPADVAGAEAAWTRVGDLSPGSDLARSAEAHLERLRSSAVIASPTPTPGR